MAVKMPRAVIDELEGLVQQLSAGDPNKRETALVRLLDHERSGRVPLEVLLDCSEAESAPLSMYAISALGRNGQKAALKKLTELADRHRAGNPLYLETIVDALGETRNAAAVTPLLAVLGIARRRGKLFSMRARKPEPDAATQDVNRRHVTLAAVRALEKIGDAKSAELLGPYLEHEEPLVRWHAIQCLAKAGVAAHNARLREMMSADVSEVVREAAAIAIERLEPLPPNLNN